MLQKTTIAALLAVATLGLAACEKQGPMEKAGEEVDEAVDTVKNGGNETTADKVDDAIDQAREDAKDLADQNK